MRKSRVSSFLGCEIESFPDREQNQRTTSIVFKPQRVVRSSFQCRFLQKRVPPGWKHVATRAVVMAESRPSPFLRVLWAPMSVPTLQVPQRQ